MSGSDIGPNGTQWDTMSSPKCHAIFRLLCDPIMIMTHYFDSDGRIVRTFVALGRIDIWAFRGSVSDSRTARTFKSQGVLSSWTQCNQSHLYTCRVNMSKKRADWKSHPADELLLINALLEDREVNCGTYASHWTKL